MSSMPWATATSIQVTHTHTHLCTYAGPEQDCTMLPLLIRSGFSITIHYPNIMPEGMKSEGQRFPSANKVILQDSTLLRCLMIVVQAYVGLYIMIVTHLQQIVTHLTACLPPLSKKKVIMKALADTRQYGCAQS